MGSLYKCMCDERGSHMYLNRIHDVSGWWLVLVASAREAGVHCKIVYHDWHRVCTKWCTTRYMKYITLWSYGHYGVMVWCEGSSLGALLYTYIYMYIYIYL